MLHDHAGFFKLAHFAADTHAALCGRVHGAVAGAVGHDLPQNLRVRARAPFVGLIATEILIGAMYGLIARFYTLGFQFTGALIGASIGLSAPGGSDPIEDAQETRSPTSSPSAACSFSS